MRFLQADNIFQKDRFLSPNQVIVLDEKNCFVEFISEEQAEKSNIQKLQGILCPGFVNTHCHLELSHLNGKIPTHTGLPDFGKHVVIHRKQLPAEEIQEHIQSADKAMWESGIVAVGDISNDSSSFKIKAESKIKYHSFIELIGLKPDSAGSIFEKGKALYSQLKEFGIIGSLAPHAPYSTSKELIQLISNFDLSHQIPFSIHNQESNEETKFFHGQENGFNELYRFLDLDISWFMAPKTSSLLSYADVLHAKSTILVHNTCTTAKDIDSVSQKDIYWCFCPAANLYIENKLPNYALFKNKEASICVGTDSLASNDTLDLVKEANIILENSKEFSLTHILQFMTYNAAKALNLQHEFGQFLPGKNTGLNLLNFSNNRLTFVKKLA